MIRARTPLATIAGMLELSAATRARDLAAMADGEVDVLVIGGGITGAGVALDAASRGLSVALVEQADIASGTSGRSSRLVHGGPRYLRQGELALVAESLRERWLLRRLAPHLVRPLPFVLPAGRLGHRLLTGVGLTLYDGLATGRNLRRHRRVSREEVSRLVPGLARPAPGHVYWDCRTDDARLTLEVVRTAAAFGILVATRAEAEDVLGEGRVRGARILDRLTGARLEVRARVTVNATGAWADRVLGMATPAGPRLRPSKGVHVVLDRARVPIRAAVLVPSAEGDGSLVFLIPWGPRVYAGTTDTAYRGPLDEPPVEAEDVRAVLASVNGAFDAGLADRDVMASWAGIRPLLDTGLGATRDLSRRHVVAEAPPGLVTVTGGKLTTYRAMAEEVVDRVCRTLRAGGRCHTRRIRLGLSRPLGAEVDRAEAASRRLGLEPAAGRRLVERYGDGWETALAMVRDDRALGHEVAPGLPVLRVELEVARARELALDDEDVLVRRTRLATMDAAAAATVSLG
jgi:glycerol-3-phosphate dehydrogenase